MDAGVRCVAKPEKPEPDMELNEVKKALAERAEDVCRHLLPGGKIDGRDWCCGDLTGGEGKSLKVCISGDRAGVWRDFAGAEGGSNLLELWIQCRTLSFLEALDECKEWLKDRGALRESASVREVKKKVYAKPEVKAITWIANQAEFYLLTDRCLTKEVIDSYKVAMTDGGDAIVFPYLHEKTAEAQMVKYLKLERDAEGKKITWTSKNTPKVLYGKHTRQKEDRYILITEGEVDSMSWKTLDIPGLCCTSVPFGAKCESKDGRDPNEEWIGNDWDFLSSFERIYLSMDMDEEGRKAMLSIIKRLGMEICFVVELPLKDANEMLKAGRVDEMRKAFEGAKTMDPAALKNSGEYRQRVLDMMYGGDDKSRRGIGLPFGKYPFHLRWNEWTLVTGINGSGKSQVVGHILVNLRKLGWSSCVASMEVPPAQTIRFYVGQAVGVKDPPREKAEKALDWIAGGFWMYDHVGKVLWQELLAAFRYAYRRHGVRFFVIDSWMKLGIDSEDLDAQGECCDAFSNFVRDCDVHLFVVAHPRKPKHDNEVVDKSAIKGSGEIADQAHNVLVIWRNKPKEKEIEKMIKMQEEEQKVLQKRRAKPDACMYVVKQRNDDGDEPTIDLWYVKNCKQYFGHYRDTGVSLLDEEVPEPPPLDPTEPAEITEDVPF